MNEYQEALDKIKNMGDKDLFNEFHIEWANTLQKLIDEHQQLKKENQKLKKENQKLKDKETPKQTKTKMNEHNHIDRRCPICDGFVYSFDKYCGNCGQRIRGDE